MKTELIISIIIMGVLCFITSVFISYIIPPPYSIIINLIVGSFIGFNMRSIYKKISSIVKEDIEK